MTVDLLLNIGHFASGFSNYGVVRPIVKWYNGMWHNVGRSFLDDPPMGNNVPSGGPWRSPGASAKTPAPLPPPTKRRPVQPVAQSASSTERFKPRDLAAQACSFFFHFPPIGHSPPPASLSFSPFSRLLLLPPPLPPPPSPWEVGGS